MDNKNVNAEWARKVANTEMSSTAAIQLEECLNKIKDAVGRNEMNAHLRIKVEPIVIKELKERGFKVAEHDNQYDGASINITW
jgi:hypothetical protein